MGRGKPSMELIGNEKSRNRTFQKRKKGLMKKSYELATLCGIDVCMIVYGDDRPTEPETWPPNPDEVRRIINMYKAKVESQVSKAHAEAELWKEDEVREILGSLDSKLEVVKRRIELKKEEKKAESSESHDLGAIHEQQPHDVQMPFQCPSHQAPQMLPIDHLSPPTMMWCNGNDFAQFGYPAPLYDQAVMHENAAFNDSGPSMSYYAPVMQPCPMPLRFAAQVPPFYDFIDPHMPYN